MPASFTRISVNSWPVGNCDSRLSTLSCFTLSAATSRVSAASTAAIMAEEDRTAEEDLAQTVVRETEREAVAAMVTAVAPRPADWIVRSIV